MTRDHDHGGRVASNRADRVGGPSESVLRALADERRLNVVSALLDQGGKTTVRVLTDMLIEREGTPRSEITRGQRDKVYLSLHHAHLPKLEEEGIVLRNPRTDVVILRSVGWARDVLARLNGIDRPGASVAD